ncbi:MAG: autotransporter outer membrane beta-barrel domain-containing protein [Nitrospira sp.]|nr:autotransporter outer membrane beta-barrel domain-containing protein [Nitrospira sp.]
MATDFQHQRLMAYQYRMKDRCWQLVLASVVIVTLTLFYQSGESSAQTLNQQVDNLLANNCIGLGLVGGTQPDTTGLGQSLSFLCDLPNQGGGASQSANTAGGGAASVQGSAASILNRTLLGRLKDLKEEERESTEQPSSMLFNSLGLMSMTQVGNMNVSSPFYASTSANGGSVATFGTSSQGRWKGLGLFASGLVESLNRDITTFQDGYKSTILGFSAGMDYRFNKSVVAGLTSSFSNTNGDFRGGGTFSTNSYGFLAFAQILPTEKTFLQVTAGYTRNNYLVSRLATAQITVDGSPPPGLPPVRSFASSNSNGDIASAGILAGYDYVIDRFLIGPRVGVNYSQTHIGSYAENGGGGIALAYDSQNIHSLQSIVGLLGSTAYSTKLGVFVHQVNADYIHEFANSQRLINVQFVEDLRANPTRFAFQNEVPVRNYFNLGTGLVAVLLNGWQPFVNFRAMVGNEQFNNYAGTFGLRIEL